LQEKEVETINFPTECIEGNMLQHLS